MFEESLHLARRAQFFVLLSAVVFSLFALSVRPTNNLYSLALKQVETAINISWEDYPLWLDEKLRKSEVKTLNETNPYLEFGTINTPIENAWENLIPYIKRHHKKVSNPELLISIYGEVYYNPHQAYFAEEVPTNMLDLKVLTPLDIVRFTQSQLAQTPATLYAISPENTHEALWQHVYLAAFFNNRYNHVLLASRLEVTASTSLSTGGSLKPKRSSQLVTAHMVVRVRGDWGDARSSDVHTLIESGQDTVFEDISVTPYSSKIPGTSILIWLQERYPALGASPDGFHPFFGIEHVWREIANRPLTDSELYVQALAAEELSRSQQVTLFGVSIPAQLVPIVAPLIILTLMIYLSRMISHIQVHAEKYCEKINEFAWIVLHTKQLWWLDPVFSLMLLPIATQSAITLKMQDIGIWITFGWIATSISLLISIKILKQLGVLRHIIHKHTP